MGKWVFLKTQCISFHFLGIHTVFSLLYARHSRWWSSPSLSPQIQCQASIEWFAAFSNQQKYKTEPERMPAIPYPGGGGEKQEETLHQTPRIATQRRHERKIKVANINSGQIREEYFGKRNNCCDKKNVACLYRTQPTTDQLLTTDTPRMQQCSHHRSIAHPRNFFPAGQHNPLSLGDPMLGLDMVPRMDKTESPPPPPPVLIICTPPPAVNSECMFTQLNNCSQS